MTGASALPKGAVRMKRICLLGRNSTARPSSPAVQARMGGNLPDCQNPSCTGLLYPNQCTGDRPRVNGIQMRRGAFVDSGLRGQRTPPGTTPGRT